MADTHVRTRARDLPEKVWREVESADRLIHAGDRVDEALLDEFEWRARRLGVIHEAGVRGLRKHWGDG